MREFLRGALYGALTAAVIYALGVRLERLYAARIYWRDIDPHIGAFTPSPYVTDTLITDDPWAGQWSHTRTGGNGHPYP